MDKKAKQLLNAQVLFTLKQYQGNQLDNMIAQNIDKLYAQFETVKTNDFVTKEQINATVRSILLAQPLKPEMLDIIHTVLLQLLDMDSLQNTAVKDLLSKKSYNLLINKLLMSDAMRKKCIGLTMESELYSELISDVLYHGIKDYLLDENFLVKMRGVSALVKVGKWGINKTLPKLDASIESTVKPYIQTNIKRTVKLSKNFLEHELNEKRIKTTANNIWKEIRNRKLATFTDPLDDKKLDELIGISEQLWEGIRTSEFMQEACTQMIEFWFQTFGNQPIRETLESIGIGKEAMISQVQTYAPTIMQQAEASGYLETVIREQLEPFYRSKEFKQALLSK